jgi:hypothetical protein
MMIAVPRRSMKCSPTISTAVHTSFQHSLNHRSSSRRFAGGQISMPVRGLAPSSARTALVHQIETILLPCHVSA